MATDSLIGYATGSIVDPTPPTASQIGFASGRIRDPHMPIGMWDGTKVVYCHLGTWNGTAVV